MVTCHTPQPAVGDAGTFPVCFRHPRDDVSYPLQENAYPYSWEPLDTERTLVVQQTACRTLGAHARAHLEQECLRSSLHHLPMFVSLKKDRGR